ncbi:hypothetical protein GCM10007938_29880 [Vibrio zhanjiangensis]|uniref:GNAT family N-acetyltransferase n=1 Tax=Vibrio zhanjiangensis TaxID=1046128 RepID=A0ABQ6F1U2_9VIBR|nr:hypothetical protein GCM10007938_29880 [Vibrio zhanjiangensis]
MDIRLIEVTKDNWLEVIYLVITKEQEDYVTLNSESIAESHFYPPIGQSSDLLRR